VEHGKRCPRCSKNGRLQLPQEGECPLTNLGDKLLLASPGTSATAGSSSSTVRVKAEAAHGSFDERSKGPFLRRVEEEQGCGEHVWVAVKAEPESPAPQVKKRRVQVKGEPPSPSSSIAAAGTGQKVLQHLDMQG